MSDPAPRNRELLLPYLLPYLAYTGVASVMAASEERALDYGLRIVACGGALAWGWRSYLPLRGPRSPLASLAAGSLVGLAGTALWIALLAPLAGPTPCSWEPLSFALRGVAAALLVPLSEELLMRGYLLGLVVQWQSARRAGRARPLAHAFEERSLGELAPGDWSPLAVLVSTAVFAAGHPPVEWPASLAYGLLMAALWIVRRDLLSCVVAHAVTNTALALGVLATGRSELW